MFSSAEIILWSQPALEWLDAYITKRFGALLVVVWAPLSGEGRQGVL